MWVCVEDIFRVGAGSNLGIPTCRDYMHDGHGVSLFCVFKSGLPTVKNGRILVTMSLLMIVGGLGVMLKCTCTLLLNSLRNA